VGPRARIRIHGTPPAPDSLGHAGARLLLGETVAAVCALRRSMLPAPPPQLVLPRRQLAPPDGDLLRRAGSRVRSPRPLAVVRAVWTGVAPC